MSGISSVTVSVLKNMLESVANVCTDPKLQATIKNISSRGGVVTVRQKDLYTSRQKDDYCDKPNYETNIASVEAEKGFHELVILSSKKD